ncbi:MAG: site-specific integrase [Muribaculaceae bacterium]|nr:site-specific integrase [Muribaculaceae bacterium]
MKYLVEPIRDKQKIKAVEDYLEHKNIRDKVIFLLGINSGLRVSDILALNVGDVRGKTHIELYEKKTGKIKKFPINRKLEVLLARFIRNKFDHEPLFKSRKKQRLDRSQVYRMLNDACSATGIEVNVGTHTMRKTFGYHHYKQFKDIAMLQMIFNHSSPGITLRYIGINQDEIDESYKEFEL